MSRRYAVVVLAALTLHANAGATQEVKLNGSMVQGGLVIGQAPPGTSVRQDGRDVPVAPDGHFLIAFGRDASSLSEVVYRFADGRVLRRRLRVLQRRYDIQRIDDLPPYQVTPSPEDLERIRAEGRLMSVARSHSTEQPFFASGFSWPARGRISGVYGSQRILNGKARRPHFGIDVAAPIGTPVVAPADGIVRLTHQGMFFNGKTIVLDHGHGLTSVFIHLDAIVVQDGTFVAKGTLLGRIGKTGRATGPHLHWGMRIGRINIDPQLLVTLATSISP